MKINPLLFYPSSPFPRFLTLLLVLSLSAVTSGQSITGQSLGLKTGEYRYLFSRSDSSILLEDHNGLGDTNRIWDFSQYELQDTMFKYIEKRLPDSISVANFTIREVASTTTSGAFVVLHTQNLESEDRRYIRSTDSNQVLLGYGRQDTMVPVFNDSIVSMEYDLESGKSRSNKFQKYPYRPNYIGRNDWYTGEWNWSVIGSGELKLKNRSFNEVLLLRTINPMVLHHTGHSSITTADTFYQWFSADTCVELARYVISYSRYEPRGVCCIKHTWSYDFSLLDVDSLVIKEEPKELSVSTSSHRKELRAYPNPTKDLVYFTQKFSGILFDVRGVPLAAIEESSSVDLNFYPKGVYILKTESAKTIRIIKR